MPIFTDRACPGCDTPHDRDVWISISYEKLGVDTSIVPSKKFNNSGAPIRVLFSFSRPMPEKRPLSKDLNAVLDSLKALESSSYIPFSSPSPCSTESALKKNVENARRCIENAVALASLLRY